MTEHRANDDPGAIRLKRSVFNVPAKTTPAQFRLFDALVAIALVGIYLGYVVVQVRVFDLLGIDNGVLSTSLLLLLQVVVIMFIVWYLKRRGLGTGLNKLHKDAWHLLWEVPLINFLALIFAAVVNALITGVSEDGGLETPTITADWVVYALVFRGLLAPFFEEMVFRRVLMGYFDTVMPVIASTILSAFLFSLAHLDLSAIPLTFAAGVGIAWATRRHRSQWAGIIVHSFNNIAVGLLTIFVTLS